MAKDRYGGLSDVVAGQLVWVVGLVAGMVVRACPRSDT